MRRSAMWRAVLGGVMGAVVIIGVVAAVVGARPSSVEPTSTASSASGIERDAGRIGEGSLDARRVHAISSPPTSSPTQAELEVADSPAEAPDATRPLDAATAPDVDPVPASDSNDAADTSFTPEQVEWLAFQQVVRDCMAGVGQEYLYWEWWSGAGTPGGMPTHLVGDGRVAWELALYGDSPGGAEYRWEDAGCWGYAAELMGTSH
jgi:hypothetical protein